MNNIEKYSYILALIKNGLHSTLNILEKSKAYAAEKGIADQLFLDFKLAPDMFSFARQIQIVSDTAKSSVAKLSAQQAPKMEDNEKSFDELIVRIKNTQDYVETFTADSFAGADDVQITFGWAPGKFISSKDYIEKFLISNFYFHITTAYGIARNNSVPIGKMDFVGNLDMKDLN